jgi:hypothetical protein
MVPQFDYYATGGRTLCCEFKCQRCEETAVVPLEECVPNDEGSRFLRNLKVPRGWSDHFYGWMLCPSCTERLKAFMSGEGL